MLVEKYLRIYSEPEGKNFASSTGEYEHVLVIPCFREGAEFVQNLSDLGRRSAAHVLVVVVVNHPMDASYDDVEQGRVLINLLSDLGACRVYSDSFRLIVQGNVTIAALGPFGIDRKMGVGRARKIGADFALDLIARGHVACPIIYCSDADASLPESYFSMAKMSFLEDATAAAFIYPFRHELEENRKLRRAMELYELRLHRYVEGLKLAGSPYAFHTIGSTLAINAQAYAKVRGFPKIAAGEDFYILNKLRKVGPINILRGEAIKLSSRISSRVPFGTGPALAKILQFDDPEDAPIFYHPQTFLLLQKFLQHHGDYLAGGVKDHDSALVMGAINSLSSISRAKQTISNRKRPADQLKAFHDWFDGLNTLKFIHYLRDNAFSMQRFSEPFSNCKYQ